jgi:Pentapeptide repeats (8 copies)
MVLASGWYNSGTFWAAAGTVAVVATGTIAIILAVLQSKTVRRLECTMSVAPLVQGSAGDPSGKLQMTWDGAVLKDPHILDITLFNRGRGDIPSDYFDQPLEFRVSVTILAVLRSVSGSSSSVFRAVDFEGDLLKVGPGLIRRHQAIKLTLLTIGSDPVLTSSAAAVRDVDVKVIESAQSDHPRPAKVKIAAGIGVVALMAVLVLIGLVIGNSLSRSKNVNASSGNHPGGAASSAAESSPTAKSSPTAESSATAISASASASLRMAEADLGSDNQASQLKGVAILRQLMGTSPAAQPDAVTALATFMRTKSPAGNNDQPVTQAIQAAVNALISRNPAYDQGVAIRLSNTNFTNANLTGINMVNAQLVNTDFSDANLNGANLQGADLNYAFAGGATLVGANLDNANLSDASFNQTTMCNGSKPTESRGYNCSANG